MKWSKLATEAMLADSADPALALSPMEQSRILAIAFLAGHDALNSIVRTYKPYRLDGIDRYVAEPASTYEVAVSQVLRTLLPRHADEFDKALKDSSIYPYGEEIELGQLSAKTLLDDRANDGSADAQGPYTAGAQPGDYQPTPPVNVATFVNWGRVRPFVMSSGDQFRAPEPFPVTSEAYAADFNEVKSLGAAVGSLRTLEQTDIAQFWLESTPLSWQRIATGRIFDPTQWSLWNVARLFAALQVSQADAYIACLESKYHYNFWRPITAIHAADSDGNPGTLADPDWQPLDPVTPPVPDYPSAHAAAATAGAEILYSCLAPGSGLTYQSSTASSPRTYTTPYYFADDAPPGEDMWSKIATQIGLSRIYVGYHFRHAVEMGWDQGRAVSKWLLGHALGAAV